MSPSVNGPETVYISFGIGTTQEWTCGPSTSHIFSVLDLLYGRTTAEGGVVTDGQKQNYGRSSISPTRGPWTHRRQEPFGSQTVDTSELGTI